MEKKKLWTIHLKNGKLETTQSEYKVYFNGNLKSVVHSNDGITNGWYFLDDEMYNRMYGENLNDVVLNRRKWLVENVLPKKMEELNSVVEEIKILSDWLNNNSQ